MAQSIKNRVFGSPIQGNLRDQIEHRQQSSKGDIVSKINDPVNTDFLGTSGTIDFSSRTPFVRMWTALSIFNNVPTKTMANDTEIDEWKVNKSDAMQGKNGLIRDDWKNKFLKEEGGETKEYTWSTVSNDFQRIYVVGNHSLNTFNTNIQSSVDVGVSSEGGMTSGEVRAVLPYEQETDQNQFMKPSAGITSMKSETEGSLGALKRTTVNFVVHNFSDFEKIYLRYFMKPGALIFVDYGWSSAALYDPKQLINGANGDYEDFLYGELGQVTLAKGDLDTIFGNVVNYDATVREDGGFDCQVEIVSKNTALIDSNISTIDRQRISNNLDTEIVSAAVSGVTGDSWYYENAVRARKGTAGSTSTEAAAVNSKLMELAGFLFGGLGVTGDKMNLPGEAGNQASLLALKYGVWVYSTSTKSTPHVYINWGWFEDNILNKEFGFSEDSKSLVNSDATKSASDENKLMAKFNSRNSFITYNTELHEDMKTMAKSPLEFIYPSTWGGAFESVENMDFLGKTYNIERDMVPGNRSDYAHTKKKLQSFQEDDKANDRIPMREIFIKATVIRKAIEDSPTPLDFLENIFDAIKKDTKGHIDLGIASNSKGQHTLAVVDKNHIEGFKDDMDKDKDQVKKEFLDDLLSFHPYSKGSIVSAYDLSFTMPQGNLANMIAIQGMSDTSTILSVNDVVKSMVNADKLDRGDETDPLKFKFVKNLPDAGAEAGERLHRKSTAGQAQIFGISDYEAIYGTNLTQDDDGSKIRNMTTDYYDFVKKRRLEIAQTMGEHVRNREKNKKSKSVKIDFSTEQVSALDDPLNIAEADKDSNHWSEVFGYVLTDTPTDWRKQKSAKSIAQRLPSTLPLQLGLSIYGINGFQPGDLVNVTYLPESYVNNVYFQIMKVTQDITDSWTTSLELIMKIYPDPIDKEKPVDKFAKIRKSYLWKQHKLQNFPYGVIGDVEPVSNNKLAGRPDNVQVYKTKIARKEDRVAFLTQWWKSKDSKSGNDQRPKGDDGTEKGKGKEFPEDESPQKEYKAAVEAVNKIVSSKKYPKLTFTYVNEMKEKNVGKRDLEKGTLIKTIPNVCIITTDGYVLKGESGSDVSTVWIIVAGKNWLIISFDPSDKWETILHLMQMSEPAQSKSWTFIYEGAGGENMENWCIKGKGKQATLFDFDTKERIFGKLEDGPLTAQEISKLEKYQKDIVETDKALMGAAEQPLIDYRFQVQMGKHGGLAGMANAGLLPPQAVRMWLYKHAGGLQYCEEEE